MPLRSGWPPSVRGPRYAAVCANDNEAHKTIVAIKYLALFMLFMFLRLRPAELSSVHRGIELHLIELKFVASSQPHKKNMERHFDSVHVSIIGIVDLRGDAANRRVAIAHFAKQQVRLLIEIQGGVNAIWASTLQNVDQPVLPDSGGFIFLHGLA